MHASGWSLARVARPSIVLILVIAALAGGVTQTRVRAADPSADPGASAAPMASPAPKTMCESVADLRLYVGFVRDHSIKTDGVLPALIGVVASLAEARTLLPLVDETYRPLVAGLITSLDGLQTALRGFRDAGTVGTGLVQLGESIVGLGSAMDALSEALRVPCPDEGPAAASPPAASASPAA